MDPRRDQSRIVSHIHPQFRADFASDFRKLGVIDLSRIGACPGNNQFRFMFASQFCDLVEIDLMILFSNSIWDRLIELTGKVQMHSVSQMTTHRQIHRQERVARLQHGLVNGHIGLRTRMRLDVHMLRPEKAFRAVDR